MKHGRGISPPDRWRGNAQRLHALFLLLAMCLTVIPHATLAASLMRIPVPASPRHEASPSKAALATAEASAEAVPCHRPVSRSHEHPASTMPLCCAIGCGLIAQAPVVALPSRVILWSRPALVAAEPLAGISLEPAKPPPRV